MFNSRLLLVSAFLSCSAMAVTMEEKINRVEFLETISSKAMTMDIDAYRRELGYEKQGLSLNIRAANEANLLAEKVRIQVQKAYDAALSTKNSSSAYEEVKNEIEKDLQLIAPDLQNELRDLAMSSLNQAEQGLLNTTEDLSGIQNVLLNDVQDRADYLNKESDGDALDSDATSTDRVNYKTKKEIIESLVSNLTSIRTEHSSGINVNSNYSSSSLANISLRVQASFLGVEVNAGPSVSFKREFRTRVSVQADGLYPVLGADGNFNFSKRDSTGKIITKNGKNEKRRITIACDANMSFETDYKGGGGFAVMGVGASANFSKKISNSVGLFSRRILLPESIDNRTVTYKDLMNLCHNDFLKGRVANVMTVEQSLNIMMKNVAANITFSHPLTKCVVDNHCLGWFKNELIALVKHNNTPRCAEEPTEKYRVCELRGLTGQDCTLRDKSGKRISKGMFEYTCDAGLTCVKVKEGGWFTDMQFYAYPEGKCLPKNSKTYKKPRY